jgi:hypothetical protein
MKHETIADIIDTYDLTGTTSIYGALCNQRQVLSEKLLYKGKTEDIPTEILRLELMEYELEGNKFLV